MKKQKGVRPSDLELQVLGVLWERGPSTVREVLSALPDGKDRAYTTVLSVMQVMERKKLLSHTRDGLTHVYRPRVQRRNILRPLVGDLVKNVFGGKPSSVLQLLLDGSKVDEEELEEIKALIDEHQSAAQKRKGGRS